MSCDEEEELESEASSSTSDMLMSEGELGGARGAEEVTAEEDEVPAVGAGAGVAAADEEELELELEEEETGRTASRTFSALIPYGEMARVGITEIRL